MSGTLLVTGAAGFIGSAVVRQLIGETSTRVVSLDKLTYAGNVESFGAAGAHDRHAFIEADICDAEAVRSTLESFRPDGILHLAAESHVDRSIDGPADFIRTNLVGTCTLLQESLRYWKRLAPDRAEAFRLVHVSTDEVFGSLGPDGRFEESTPYDPSSPYSASKAGSDHLARAWQRTYGLPVVVTNCSNNYGPYQFPEKLIPLMIQKGVAQEPMPVYGRGVNTRDWLHVDDHVRGLRLALEKGAPGRTYCIGGGNERRNIDVVRAICRILDELRPLAAGGHDALISYVADRPGHDLRYAINPARARNELGWSPRHVFEQGLRETVEWYLANEAWVDHVRTGSYRGQRLGLGASA